MIVGSGIDVIETARLERELDRALWKAKHGIFSSTEIQYCNHSKRPAQQLAGCFAAKEAALKALGVEVVSLADFQDIEVAHDPNGKCSLNLRGRALSVSQSLGVKHASVAVTTGRQFSGAVVMLES